MFVSASYGLAGEGASPTVTFESLDALPARVVLPEPELEVAGPVVGGLEFDPSGRLPILSSLPELAEVAPAPGAGRSLVVSFAGSGVLLPPGVATIPLRRLMTGIVELVGVDALLEAGDDVGFILFREVSTRYAPFPVRESGGRTLSVDGPGGSQPFVFVTRELLEGT